MELCYLAVYPGGGLIGSAWLRKTLVVVFAFCFVSFRSVRFAWQGGIASRCFFFPLVSLLLLSPQHVSPAFLVYTVYPPFFVMLVLPSCYHFIESELRMFWIDTTCYVQLPFSIFYRYITL
jgi:hypothetical protein